MITRTPSAYEYSLLRAVAAGATSIRGVHAQVGGRPETVQRAVAVLLADGLLTRPGKRLRVPADVGRLLESSRRCKDCRARCRQPRSERCSRCALRHSDMVFNRRGWVR